MPIYTVHEPPPRKKETAAGPDRFVFIRDGFYFWAFLFGPLWMLWHRLWAVAILYVLTLWFVWATLATVGLASAVQYAVLFLIALLVGLEAATLWRWTLARRGWKQRAIVVGADRDSAERRFFDSWIANARTPAAPAAAPPAPAVSPAPMRMPPSQTDVIGLFPEPQPRR
jgi:hypothetical protein